MNANEIIEKYNDINCKRFDSLDILEAIAIIPEEERSCFCNSAEWLAFVLVENSPESWGTYYGPQFVRNDGTNVPPKEMITNEIVDYWEDRAIAVENPLLKERYSGLVVAFKHKCNGEIRNTYFHTLLDSVNGNYVKYSISAFFKLKRAFQLAIESTKDENIQLVKDALVNYEKKDAQDKDSGIWGRVFELMLNNLNYFSVQEQNVNVKKLEDRVDRLLKEPNEKTYRSNAFAVEEGVELLAQYYNKKQDRGNLERVLKILDTTYHSIIPQMSALQASNIFNKLYRIYSLYQFNTEAKIILGEIQKITERISDEMSNIEVPFSISKSQIDNYVNNMTSGTFVQVISKFIFHFIPNKNQSEEQLLESVKNAPFVAMCPTKLFDYKGRPTSIIGGIKEDIEGRLIIHVAQTMEISSHFMNLILQKNIENKIFSCDTIFSFLQESPFFEEDRKTLIHRSLTAFFDNDYVLFLHLIIPQIENAIRNIIEILNKSTIKPQKNNSGFQLKTFDELLRDPVIVNIDENLAFYFRILFTDQRGWNIRNLLCHGIAPLAYFNQMIAERVFHALMCIGGIVITENNTNN